ncbi:hypothetical protein [Alteromonas macleodii]|uniref:hypothetical protein n=1 Tax=Alteromonas macleodii TaxID=28108 RepID=UPI0031409E5B|tara:strand:+ start:6179 stop:6916 length:738 start_codon:yes stop_codon:yes gene_type:complete
MSVLENKKSFFKWLITLILGATSFYICIVCNASYPVAAIHLVSIIFLAFALALNIDDCKPLPYFTTLYILLSLLFSTSIYVYESESRIDSPITGASGFILGKPFDRSFASENLTYLGNENNYFTFIDLSNPQLSVYVHVDHNSLVYKIEHSFDFSSYEPPQRMHLTETLELTVLKNHNASHSAFWYDADIYDGENSVDIDLGLTLSNPIVTYTNQSLEKSHNTFLDDTDVVALKKKLNFMTNTKH